MTKKHLMIAAGATALIALAAGQAYAQDRSSTPRDWGYEIVNGKRVPKAKRDVSADGSWREERRAGDCVEVKERNAQGEIHITRTCDDDAKPN